VVKLLVDNPDKAFENLKKQNLTVTKRKVTAVEIENISGAMHKIISKISQNGINIEDCYGFLLKDGKTAVIVLEIENSPEVEGIIKTLGLNILSENKLYNF